RNGKPYCRLCLSFRGKEASPFQTYEKNVFCDLRYPLSDEQKELSNSLLEAFKEHKNSFVCAVCGSGKTEIVLLVIQYAISVGYKVGFTVPRRDVAVELAQRFKSLFPKITVTTVYGGHTDMLYGDLIITTTHQLFRYPNFFDLLVFDEVDAFPYKGSDVLNAFFKKCCKGNFIMLSATPENTFLQDFGKMGGKVFRLNFRYHKYPLPLPQILVRPPGIIFGELVAHVRRYLKVGKQVFIFVPTIEMCEEIGKILGKIVQKPGFYVHSKQKERARIIEKFKRKEYQFLVTTAVLERGVTVNDLQVIVYHADHSIYDQYSLIQIAGRVGRKINAPTGEVLFIGNRVSEAMERAVAEIERSNKDLQDLF
ncbi:MAG: DEAD/DEAH box helicase, partial [Bacilli bacterium]|nr:DEAD/DEAH box helicase [Bacilli bacterium]